MKNDLDKLGIKYNFHVEKISNGSGRLEYYYLHFMFRNDVQQFLKTNEWNYLSVGYGALVLNNNETDLKIKIMIANSCD